MLITCDAYIIVGWKIDVIKLLEWLTDELQIKECAIYYTGIIDSIPEDKLPTGWIIKRYNPYYRCPEDELEYYFQFNFKGKMNYCECIKMLTEEQIKEGEAFVENFGVDEPMIMTAIENWY